MSGLDWLILVGCGLAVVLLPLLLPLLGILGYRVLYKVFSVLLHYLRSLTVWTVMVVVLVVRGLWMQRLNLWAWTKYMFKLGVYLGWKTFSEPQEEGFVYLARNGDYLKVGMTTDWRRREEELNRYGWEFLDVDRVGSKSKAFKVEAKLKGYLKRRCLTFGKVYHGPGGSEVWHRGEYEVRSLTSLYHCT